ncbi:hypothetical protein ANO11243_038890 [Dothideomycetidae sp. 11243]|nr:hypothetical protein ANO11243_038890 [fungal sp. No.11243]
METIPRNTPALLARIDQLRNSLIKRFENLIELANVRPSKSSDGAQLIDEDLLSLIRQMQELWLFGQLNTLEVGGAQDEVDAKAAEVATLLQKLTALETPVVS